MFRNLGSAVVSMWWEVEVMMVGLGLLCVFPLGSGSNSQVEKGVLLPERLPKPELLLAPTPDANLSGNKLTVEEWVEHTRTDVKKGICYKKVMARMAACTLYDSMWTTQGWKTTTPRYRAWYVCSQAPFEGYLSAQKEVSGEVLSQGPIFCEDAFRVWVHLPGEAE